MWSFQVFHRSPLSAFALSSGSAAACGKGVEAVEGVGPFGPPERPMGGYLSLPDAWADHPELAAAWVERAFAHVSTLPPKAKKAPKKR